MMHICIFVSFFLLGMASADSVTDVTSCLTKNQDIQITCKYSLADMNNTVCTFKMQDKVVATSDKEKQDASIQLANIASFTKDECKLILKKDKQEYNQMFSCNIKKDEKDLVTNKITVNKESLKTCSAGSVLQYGEVTLLLALFLPLVSKLL